jgi:hypothetical protein
VCADAFVHLFLFESRALCVNLRVDGTVHRQYVHPIFCRCVQGEYRVLVMQVLSRHDVRLGSLHDRNRVMTFDCRCACCGDMLHYGWYVVSNGFHPCVSTRLCL